METNSGFNKSLVQEIESRLPKKNDQLLLLTDVLSIAKEAAYRRLRGDVPFSFTESCMLAKELEISLDSIVGAESDKHSSGFKIFAPSSGIDVVDHTNYYINLAYQKYEAACQKYEDRPISIMTAYNTIPSSLLQNYPLLFQFRAYKWGYQMHRGGSYLFESLDIEKDRMKVKELVYRLYENAEISFIFGRQIFVSFFKQILHFHELRFISDEHFLGLKEELLHLLDTLEWIATGGQSDRCEKIWLYLSHVDFENNYTYVKGENIEEAYIPVYQIHSIYSSDQYICQITKEWIESLIKYSTLISISGEKERISFFEKQRDYISGFTISKKNLP